MIRNSFYFVLIICVCFIFTWGCDDDGPSPEEYDLVIKNGDVMDPLSQTVQIANVYINDGKIEEIVPVDSDNKDVIAATEIDAEGLVVAPGFIDAHGHETELSMTMEAHLLDGVTTMFGGNCGHSWYPVDLSVSFSEYLSSLESEGVLINYVPMVGHVTLRNRIGITDIDSAATTEQIAEMVQIAEQALQVGAFGVSYGLQYVPGASYDEVLALGNAAATYNGMTACHGRVGGVIPEAIDAVNEMIQLARDTNIPHEYSHLGSMVGSNDNMDIALELINQAQAEGVKICGDIYPYDAASTMLSADIFSPGFFERTNSTPQDAETASSVVTTDGELLMNTGDRFSSEEEFYEIRDRILAGEVVDFNIIVHIIKKDKIKLAMQNPYICVGTDGAVSLDTNNNPSGHPRVAGSFSRFLGYWVRQENTVPLMEGLFKTSTRIALFLGLTGKGTVSVGADADITIFDPDTVIDRATFGEGFLTPPDGIEYVIVNGVVVAEDGAIVASGTPGQVIRREWDVPGYSIED